ASGIIHATEGIYLRMLRWSLAHRGVIVLICLATFLSTFGLYQLVGRDWIPSDDQGELISSFTIPEGTSLQKTTQQASEMAPKIVALPAVAFVRSYTHGPTNHDHFCIVLLPRSERKKTHEQVA